MMNNSISSPIFWMYFSYVLSFIIPLFCGLTLLTVKGAISNEQAGMHPRRLLGIIFTFSGLIFIPNMIQDIHKYITGELGLPIFDIAINLFLVPLYFFYFRKRHARMNFFVNYHCGSERAGSEACDSFQAHKPVGRSFALLYPEPFFERRQ